MTRRSKHPIVRSERFVTDAMRAWGDAVWGLALACTGSRADADDVYQDVFLSLARNGTDLSDGEHLKAWLLRVTINRCREFGRMARRHRSMSLDKLTIEPEDPGAAEGFSQVEREEVWQAVRQLRPKYREVIHLHYQEGMDCSAIAQILGIPASTVATRLQRARTQLRMKLGDEWP
ncbi:MAG: sigma-70 family RNA polymerase sigma factor [Coriobacteriia bacterium]|nr:sigma-70 family RNA polymerase sigma factor [Coriobacteriia bacterium]MBS5478865.1 sigma-70 family RNA polymerase sigma factor [Coriobacteriia bacterium]